MSRSARAGVLPQKDMPRYARTESQLLSIHFVNAHDGRIRGTLDPHWDPDRGCEARASFLGSVDGDVISGSFVSFCEDGVRTWHGRWRVERKRSK
jgi:hypothetical protein